MATIEARSLSSLNHIAAHPPQYPINPVERHDTLTLYISRVPGCRDIILSTFKPQRKVVGGEDVANSLYYIHLDTPGDDILASQGAAAVDNGASRPSMESARTQRIARKPLPSTAKVHHLQDVPSDATPEPLPDTNVVTDQFKYPPLNSSSHDKENVHLGEEAAGAADPFRDGAHTAAQPPPTKISTNNPHGSSNKKPFTPFSLSIIRRDPGTGHQWNIGKVSSFQSTIVVAQDPQNPDSPKIAQYPKGYPAINVHIETSGYARFRNFPTALPKMSDLPRMSLDSTRPGSSGSAATRNMKELAASLQAQVDQQKGQDDTEEGFRRQVAMTYTKTWTSNLKEAFSGKRRERSSTNTSATDSNYNEPLDPPRAGFHRRHDSGNSTNSNDSISDASATSAAAAANTTVTTAGKPDEPVIAARPGAGLRPKGYTFASPWDGRCEFRTSSNGRALKCHHIRNTTSQGFNPLVAAQAIRDAMPESNGSGGGGAGRSRARGMSASLPIGDMGNRVPVSELRFNLPSSDLFNSKEDRDRAVAEMKEGLGRLLVRSPGGHDHDDADDDDREEPIFDFSGLGREKAGGGNRGKRAKLGKLLVHDEGLKMLDLVVAANMGIWWQAWERSF
ncbi:hypothetical protein UCDDA912_g05949 [Diaporthe ampelina]|uniref:Oxidoreductase-like protein n=1 Tax=Diaporthe ampelina TaxID=1214573 RepID=A0A0G2FHZ8_9PEZI|nr:hypothetical protein UCDDA912_g05949 [Diaporthe ampelina]